MLNNIPIVQEELKKCVRCGLCRSVCPIFREIENETAAPRGHVFLVQMLRDGVIDPSSQVMKRLNRCLLCETCSVNCPSGIHVPELVAETRSLMAPDFASPIKNFVFQKLWANPASLKAISKMIWAYQFSGLQKISEATGITKLLPGDLSKAQSMLMEVPLRSARSYLPEINPAKGAKKLRVGYFLGCATDLFYPNVAKAAVKVLVNNGCEVIIPRKLKCCGMPQYANGQKKTAEELAAFNVDLFSQYDLDYIVTDCASCGSALTSSLYQNHPEFTSKVIDLTKFLTTIIEIDRDFALLPPVKVTYHDPCHLVKSQKVSAEPRNLLKMLPHVELIEMKEADQCCGGAGTFGLYNYDLSMKILDRKAANIKDTGAEIAATCCPTCTMQLNYGIKRGGINAVVKHPVELLAEAYQ